MSTGTDGTPPPSIAPKNPPAGPGVRTSDGPRPRPASGPLSGSSSPAATVPAEEEAPTTMGERLKRAASGVADTARSAIPSRDGDDETETKAAAPAPRPASRPSSTTTTSTSTSESAPAAGPRRVRLAVSRIDPWSVMKLSFLLSVAIGIMIVVAAAVVWQTLNSLEVFTQVNTTIAEITGSTSFFDLLEFVAFDRVISLAVMVAVVDVVLLTALSTIGAFLYNIVAALVGGIHLTLTDD